MKALDFSQRFGIAAALFGMALPSAAIAQTKTVNVEAGPIWNQSDAERKCPQVAKTNGGVWTGQWHTTVPGRMSVCELRLPSSNGRNVREVEAGPIWSQMDAERKCPALAKANGGVWTGQWRTTVPGQMSVCELRFSSWNGIPAPKPAPTANPWRGLRFGTATIGSPVFGKIEVLGGWAAVRRDDKAARACVSFKNSGAVTATRVVFEFPIIDRSDQRLGELTLDRRGTFSPGIDINSWSSMEAWQQGGTHRGYDENCTSLTLNVASFPLRTAHFVTYRIKRVEYTNGTFWTPEGSQ
jgi:Mannan-binding protein